MFHNCIGIEMWKNTWWRSTTKIFALIQNLGFYIQLKTNIYTLLSNYNFWETLGRKSYLIRRMNVHYFNFVVSTWIVKNLMARVELYNCCNGLRRSTTLLILVMSCQSIVEANTINYRAISYCGLFFLIISSNSAWSLSFALTIYIKKKCKTTIKIMETKV